MGEDEEVGEGIQRVGSCSGFGGNGDAIGILVGGRGGSGEVSE